MYFLNPFGGLRCGARIGAALALCGLSLAGLAQPISVRPEFPRELREVRGGMAPRLEPRLEPQLEPRLDLSRSSVTAPRELAAPSGGPVTPRTVLPRGDLLPDEQRIVALFEQAAPAVAYITTELVQTNAQFEREQGQGAGSGFLWDTQGHIVTSSHVLENARRILVQLDAGKPIEATVVGRAPEYDLAVIRLTAVPAHGISPIPLGESRTLKIGQRVYAIGNPFGLQRTLTQGIVSALERELPTTSYREIVGVVQTDAAINPGSSGGPLLDSAGRLVGMNAAIRSGPGGAAAFAGISFAIPVDMVNRIVPALIARGRAPLPGIGVTPLRADIARRAGISGVVLADVEPAGPAAQAGLTPFNKRTGELGDVVVAANGRAIGTMTALVAEIDRVGVDGTLDLTVLRTLYPNDQRERKVQVRVIDMRR